MNYGLVCFHLSPPSSHALGYFTSRPALKGYVREMNSLLQSCKQFEVLGTKKSARSNSVVTSYTLRETLISLLYSKCSNLIECLCLQRKQWVWRSTTTLYRKFVWLYIWIKCVVWCIFWTAYSAVVYSGTMSVHSNSMWGEELPSLLSTKVI